MAQDGDGNTCHFHNCGYGSTSPGQYFGGGSGDIAGTLCCPVRTVTAE